MATHVRNLFHLLATQAITVLNGLRLDVLRVRAGVVYHADATAVITAANATDLPSSIVLITALQVAYTAHIASACSATTGQGAHLAADATNVLAAPTPTDLASSETAVNELKTAFNAHRVLTSSHPVADSVNAVSTATATDLPSTEALANAIKVAFNAHVAAALASQATLIVPA